MSARPSRIVRILQESVHTSGQTAVRASILVLAALVLLAADAGFDFVLGAFAAGLVVGVVVDTPEGRAVKLRLEGIGYGFLIPIYFVTTGMNLDINSLLSPTGIGLAALFLLLLFVARGASALLWLNALRARETLALARCTATGLPLIVAIVGIGSEHRNISPAVGASLIGAGFLSMLLYPVATTLLVRPSVVRMEADPSLHRGRRTNSLLAPRRAELIAAVRARVPAGRVTPQIRSATVTTPGRRCRPDGRALPESQR